MASVYWVVRARDPYPKGLPSKKLLRCHKRCIHDNTLEASHVLQPPLKRHSTIGNPWILHTTSDLKVNEGVQNLGSESEGTDKENAMRKLQRLTIIWDLKEGETTYKG